MSDLIERQKAIDSIGKCTDIYVNNLPTMIDKAEAYKALNELPSAQPEPHWIPVSERQPVKGGYYLVTDTDGDVEIAWFRYDFDYEELDWWLEEYGFIDVIAWMPLPTAYKEGEQDG